MPKSNCKSAGRDDFTHLYFYFIWCHHSHVLSSFPFSSNVSKIILPCNFLYSYLVYGHKKQNIMCFITRRTKRALATVKKSPRIVPAPVHIPQTNEKEEEKTTTTTTGKKLPAEQQFLWSNHFFMALQLQEFWAKGISWQTGRGNETKEPCCVGCLQCCVFLPGEQQRWRTAGD